MWFASNLLVLIGVGFVLGSDQCRQSCSTWSQHNNKPNNLSYIPCDIQGKVCKMKATNESYPINPNRPKINKQRNWYLYKNPADGANHIALNFSWSPNHDGSVEYLQAYQVKIHRKRSHTTSLFPDLLLYFCFENKFEFNRHLLSQFYYDCYGLTSDQLIQPGDTFNIYISSLPQPGPMLDYEHRNLEIQIPECDNKNLATEAYCEQLNSAFVKVKRTFYANRTVLISYSIPKMFGQSVTILVCYAEEYNPYFNLCDIEHDISGLPMSDNNYYFVLPKDFDVHTNISLSVYGNSTNSHRFKQYFTFTPEVKKSDSDSPVVFIAIAIGSVLLLIVIAFVMLCKFRPESAKHVAKFCCPALLPNPQRSGDNNDHSPSNNVYVEVDTVERKPLVKVCIAFVEDNSLHRDVVLAFASYLQTDLGFEVMLELWQRDEIFKDCSSWIEKVLNSADKIIVIWSPGANQRWEIQKNGANAVPLDLFTPILKKIKNDLVFGRNKGRYFFTYFQYCSENDIPQSFRDKSPCYFKIMPQIKELYFRLIDQEMFQPGAIINEKKAEYETYSGEDLNKFGAILKSKIAEMSKFAGNNPNWRQQSSTIQTQVSIDPSVDDEVLQINKLVIEPPPPLLVDSQPVVCNVTKKDIPSPVETETPARFFQTSPACKHYTKPATILDEKPKRRVKPLAIVVPKRTPCENAEVPAPQNFQQFPVLEPLGNLTDKDESFVQDSGFSTQSPLISSLQSECDGSIHPSSFHFDDNDSDNDEPALPAIQLVPIDTEKDPWESLASFNF